MASVKQQKTRRLQLPLLVTTLWLCRPHFFEWILMAAGGTTLTHFSQLVSYPYDPCLRGSTVALLFPLLTSLILSNVEQTGLFLKPS